MEQEFESLLVKSTIKKINRNHSNNIFSEILNKNLIYIIMEYLTIKDNCDFRKASIFIHNTFIDYENKKISEIIFAKEKESLLRINLKDKKQGFCFICEIPKLYEFDNLGYSVIINNHFINDLEDNKLKIVYKNKNIEIDLNNKFKFIDKDYNITIVDIENNYDIQDYFHIQNLFEYKNNTKENTIYILYYSEDKKVNISFGDIKETDNKTIFRFLNSKNDFPIGSPIFNSKTKELIGYYKGFNNEKHYNEGQYFRYPLNNFICENNITNEIDKNPENDWKLRLLIKRIKNFIDFPDEKFILISNEEPYDSEHIQIWNFVINIIDECPYKGGKFLFSFHYPRNINSCPPQIQLITKIYHPNFIGDGNDIFYDCNENSKLITNKHYHPVIISKIMVNGYILMSIYEILDLIYSLIINPSLKEGDIINKECAKEMENYNNYYINKAKDWTEEYSYELY